MKRLRISANSRYFLTISYIFMLIYKILLAGQYLYSVPDYFPVLFVFPLSVIMTAADFIVLFVFFRILDFANKFRLLDKFYFAFFVVAGAFLLYDFAIFQYFRGFDNLGLGYFMAFDLISDAVAYFLFSLNPFLDILILFWLFLFVLAFLFVFKRKTAII